MVSKTNSLDQADGNIANTIGTIGSADNTSSEHNIKVDAADAVNRDVTIGKLILKLQTMLDELIGAVLCELRIGAN